MGKRSSPRNFGLFPTQDGLKTEFLSSESGAGDEGSDPNIPKEVKNWEGQPRSQGIGIDLSFPEPIPGFQGCFPTLMGDYKNWEGKSSSSAPELQEVFPEKAIPSAVKIGKKRKKKFKLEKKIPKIGNMNKIMDGIFLWDIQSSQSSLGFAVSRENSFRNE